MTDPAPNPAAAWLLAEFEEFNPDYIQAYDPDADDLIGPACVQPMFTLKTDTEPGAEMRVTAADYADHHRRWL